eukprot:1591462-Amphidinium_carterae.1
MEGSGLRLPSGSKQHLRTYCEVRFLQSRTIFIRRQRRQLHHIPKILSTKSHATDAMQAVAITVLKVRARPLVLRPFCTKTDERANGFYDLAQA